MFFRKSSTVKYLIAVCLGSVLYCEWIVFVVQPWYWPRLQCPPEDNTCTKLLFIADPQIQGDNAVAFPLNYIFNWDSDRYLKSTFSVVIDHFRPDVLIYLGDLMDEGSISTMAQFHGYVKRLSNIFDVHYSIMQVWLPGDNDIGGENEPVSKYKAVEFEKIFDQAHVLLHKNISFYKVNGITHTFLARSEPKYNQFKIVLSHYPLTKNTAFGQQVNKAIRPNIYFCAHDHDSKYVKQNMELSHKQVIPLKYGDDILEIDFFREIYEIYVPTCSYRMGTSKMGYGAAVLTNNNEHMSYTVFWSPTRFPYLVFYLILVITLIVYCGLYKVCHRRSSDSNRTYSRIPDILPLLEKQ